MRISAKAEATLVRKIPSDMDTVDTLEGLRRTDGVGREAQPGEAGPVGGN